MAEVIRSRYLDRRRRSVAAVYREVVRRCRVGGLPVPARSTLARRIEALDPAAAAAAREGADGARRLHDAQDEAAIIGPRRPIRARLTGPGSSSTPELMDRLQRQVLGEEAGE